MKKLFYLRAATCLPLVTALCFLLTACGPSCNGEGGPVSIDDIRGTWEIYETDVSGRSPGDQMTIEGKVVTWDLNGTIIRRNIEPFGDRGMTHLEPETDYTENYCMQLKKTDGQPDELWLTMPGLEGQSKFRRVE